MAGRKPTISDKEILEFFVNSDDPFLTTSEVADLAGFTSSDGSRPRLKSLEDDGYVESKKVGRSIAWWITDSGREYLEKGN